MSFNKFLMTKKGLDLQAKIQTGSSLKFTRIAIGSGNINDSKDLINLENLIEYKETFQISDIKSKGDGTAVISSIISNENITQGFFLREIGVFAEDPDIGEILYCISNAGEYADFFPAESLSKVDISLEIITIVGNTENLEIIIDDNLVFATKKELNDISGEGLTNETIKKNADDILTLAIEVLLLKQAALTNFTGSNMFIVNFKELSAEESFDGVWNIEQKRLEV